MSKTFFKNARFLAISEIISKLKFIIIIPLLTKAYGSISYGAWSQVSVLIVTITPIVVLGTDSAILRYLPGTLKEERKRNYTAWVLFLFSVSILTVSVMLLFRNEISQGFFGEIDKYVSFIPLAALSLMVTLMLNTTRIWCRVENNVFLLSIISISQAILGIFAMVFTLLYKKGIYELVLYSTIGDTLIIIIMFCIITKRNGWAKPNFVVIPMLLKYGLPLVPAGYAMWGLNSMDRLFLVKYDTIANIGVYALIYNVGYLLIQLIINPIWMMFPNNAADLFNNKEFEKLNKLFQSSIRVIFLLVIPATIGLFILGRPLLLVLTTPEFTSGANLIVVITIGYIFHMLASYYDTILGLLNKQYISTISIMIAVIINLILNFALIPEFKIYGAGIATSTAFLVQFLISFSMCDKYYKMSFNYRILLRIILLSAIMGTGVYILSLFLAFNPLILLVCSVVFGVALYFSLLLITKEVPLGNVKAIMTKATKILLKH